MYSSFGDDVGVKTVAKVDGVDVVAVYAEAVSRADHRYK